MRPLPRTATGRTAALLLAAGLAVALTACGTGGSGPAGSSAGSASSSAPSAAGSSPASPAASSSAPADPSTAPNGMADASDAKVLAAATAAFRAASSVHVVGEVVSGGTKIVLDIQAGRDKTGRGSVTVGDARFDVVVTGKDVYLGGNDAFWKQSGGKGAVSLFRGKYIRTTRTSPDFAGIATFFDLGDLGSNLLPHDSLAGTKKGTVGGVPVRILGDGGDARYAVATVGTPYPLEFSGTDGADRVALRFDRYDATIDLTPPPADKVVDAADFKK